MSVKVVRVTQRTVTVNDTSAGLTLNQLSTGAILTLQRNSTTLWTADKNAKVTHSGEYAITGVINVSAVGSPSGLALTVVGTAGATTYGYKVSATNGGYETEVSAEVTAATGNATLSATNYITVSWTKKAGATGYKVYRTTGGATQGLIATITDRDTATVDDTGLAGDSTTGPTVDRTGTVALADDTYIALGTDDDAVIFHKSATLAANTARAGVLVGTPVSQALAANSMLFSNITASGDLAFYGNLGGNSIQWLFYDTSASTIYLQPAGLSGVTLAAGSAIAYKGSGDTVSYLLNLYKSRGTVASPTVITSGDILGTLQGYGYAGATNGYVAGPKVELYSAGTIADTSTGRIPGGVKLYYATDASPSVVKLGFLLSESGAVGIGVSTAGLAPLQVAVPFAKTDTTIRTVALFGSNEGATSYGLKVGMIGGASIAASTSTLQTGDDSTNAGVLHLQKYGGTISIGSSTEVTISAAGVLATANTSLTLGGIAYTVPPDDGDAGEQLQTNGTGTLTWESAASRRSVKNVYGVLDPRLALQRVIDTPIELWKYRPDAKHVGGDYETEFAGIVADRAPWAMKHNGTIFNEINAAGHAFAAIQALYAEISELKAQLASR